MLADITPLESEAQLRSEKLFSETLIDSLPGIFFLFNHEGRLVRWNQAYQTVLGYSPEQLDGLELMETIYPDDRAYVASSIQQILTQGTYNGEARVLTRSGEAIPYYLTGRRMVLDGAQYLLGTGVDISERKQAEAERARLQEEIIAAQEATLRELSTPLIPFSDEVVVMPLVGSVDSRRAQQVLETLLQGIAAGGASVAILDITGVAVVDTQVANALVRAAQAVNLLGAQVVLTGIRPEVAQTLVGLGVDLGGIVTRGTLQSGIAYALERSTREAPATGWVGARP